MATTLWDAQEALVDLLRNGMTGDVPVTLGSPANKESTHIWVSGDVDTWEKDYVVSNLSVHDERYTLQVECLVIRSANDYGTPRARMQTLLDDVISVVRSNPTLDGAVSLAVVERITMDEGVTEDKERAIGSTVFVRCEADAVT